MGGLVYASINEVPAKMRPQVYKADFTYRVRLPLHCVPTCVSFEDLE